jgi:hypothetical protein
MISNREPYRKLARAGLMVPLHSFTRGPEALYRIAIGGRWRAEPSWIDRGGRLRGVFWIATTPFAWFTYQIGG